MPTFQLSPEESAYYRAQSSFSDPGALADRYEADLSAGPADPAALARAVRGLLVHRAEGGLFGHAIAEDRLRDDAETRYADDILRLIVGRDDAPLTRPRRPGDRFVGVCRDFSLLHCSMLRHAGIPARVRIGFADYFGPLHGDHVVTEYWDAERGWLLADAQLADPAVAAAHGVDFDPMDVPRDRFLVAGAAWRAIRSGGADPDAYGHQDSVRPLVGAWFVAGSVRLDMAALNKVETLLWDVWGAGADSDEDFAEDTRALFDMPAELTAGEVPFDAVRKVYADDEGLRAPKTVLSLAPFNGPVQATLRG
ncbi:transglutaminase-like domain-containing protein [Catenulispora subtropica]|uniref:Transglutaminase-like domain-containing protein n=1 Tax=Catenulispora subtropica TaxID=450798 RepID=A0ABN2SS64_9ACTN